MDRVASVMTRPASCDFVSWCICVCDQGSWATVGTSAEVGAQGKVTKEVSLNISVHDFDTQLL